MMSQPQAHAYSSSSSSSSMRKSKTLTSGRIIPSLSSMHRSNRSTTRTHTHRAGNVQQRPPFHSLGALGLGPSSLTTTYLKKTKHDGVRCLPPFADGPMEESAADGGGSNKSSSSSQQEGGDGGGADDLAAQVPPDFSAMSTSPPAPPPDNVTQQANQKLDDLLKTLSALSEYPDVLKNANNAYLEALSQALKQALAAVEQTRRQKIDERRRAASSTSQLSEQVALATRLLQSFLTARIQGLGAPTIRDPVEEVVRDCLEAYDKNIRLADLQISIGTVEGAMASRSKLDEKTITKRDQELSLLLTWVETVYITMRLCKALRSSATEETDAVAAALTEIGRQDLAKFALGTIQMARDTGMTAEKQVEEARRSGLAPPGSAVETMRISTRIVLLTIDHFDESQ